MAKQSSKILVFDEELITTYSPDHRLHAGQVELLDQKLVPSFESPERPALILAAMRNCKLLSDAAEATVAFDLAIAHDAAYLTALDGICTDLAGTGRVLLPAVWPGDGRRPQPQHPANVRLGAWSRDSFTSVGGGTYAAAQASVGSVVHALGKLVERGNGAAFALGRPPHHHAGSDFMAGYCYLNGTGLAARLGREQGLKIAVIDLDYHHGNGTQELLYRTDALFCSIHGDPAFSYPYYSGFADEIGEGPGEGYNLNIPLGEQTGWPAYREALGHLLGKVRGFGPDLAIVSLGVDTFSGDPIGRFRLETDDFARMGSALAGLGVPMLFVMEGGYAVTEIGVNVSKTLCGFLE